MAYQSKITERQRALIILLIDQSGSMSELYGGTQLLGTHPRTKAEIVAQASNLLLMNIVDRCCQGNVYKHYFDIGAIGYSGKGVYSLLSDGRWLLSPSEMAATVKSRSKILRRVKSVEGVPISYYTSIKVWIEPYCDGPTPMLQATNRVSELLHSWQNNQKLKNNFPPIIIHITDGEFTDANEEELISVRNRITAQGTDDGEPIFFNFHISGTSSEGIMFPTSIDELPVEAHLLYKLSSTLPNIYNSHIAELKNDTETQEKKYRGVSFNLPISDFIKALEIGTTTTDQLHL